MRNEANSPRSRGRTQHGLPVRIRTWDDGGGAVRESEVSGNRVVSSAEPAWRPVLPGSYDGSSGAGIHLHFWYNIRTATGLALESIRAHKLRSFLTLLGIIIGVASVILVGSAIDGLGVYAEEITAREFGSESYLIAQIASAGRLTRRQLVEKQRTNKRIRPEDVAYLRATPGARVVYSPYQQRFDDVKAKDRLYQAAAILGASAALAEIRNIPIA